MKIQRKLLKESVETDKMSKDQKKQFLESVYKFSEYADSIYRPVSLEETTKYLRELIEAAGKLTLEETDEWFDNVTVSRHMKQLSESYKLFEKTSKEISVLQQRLESLYEDIGSTLGKYYDIKEMVREAQETMTESKSKKGSGEEYQKYLSKGLEKFKIDSPEELETAQKKKKFFKHVDSNYSKSKKMHQKKKEANKAPKDSEVKPKAKTKVNPTPKEKIKESLERKYKEYLKKQKLS